MDGCIVCKNTYRQRLLLKCHHDICIQCAANHYFIGCKNDIRPRKGGKEFLINNPYDCEVCQHQTRMEISMVNQLRDYFLNNFDFQQASTTNRKQNVKGSGNILVKKASVDYFRALPNNWSRIGQSYLALQRQVLEGQTNAYQFNTINNARLHSDKSKVINNIQAKRKRDNYEMPKKARFRQAQINQYQLNNFDNQRDDISQRDKLRHKLINKLKCRCQACNQKVKYQMYRQGNVGISCDRQIAHNFLLKDDRVASSRTLHSGGLQRSSKKVIVEIEKQRQSNSKDNKNKQQMPIISIKRSYKKESNSRKNKPNLRLRSCKSEDTLQNLACNNLNEEIRRVREKQKEGMNSMEQHLWQIESKSTKKFHESYLKKDNTHVGQNIVQPKRPQDKIDNFEKIIQRYFQENSSEAKLNSIKGNIENHYCQMHKKQKTTIFCQRCSCLVCFECAKSLHEDHQTYSLKQSAMYLSNALNGRLNILVNLINEQNNSETISNKQLQQINVQSIKQRDTIKNAFQNLLRCINKKYSEILKEIQDKSTLLLNYYNEKINKSVKTKGHMNKIRDRMVDILQKNKFDDRIKSETPVGVNCGNDGSLSRFFKRQFRENTSEYEIENVKSMIGVIEQFEKHLNIPKEFLSLRKRQSLLSQNFSLKLSDSSNLLSEFMEQSINQSPLMEAVSTNINTNSPKEERVNPILMSPSRCKETQPKIQLFDCELITVPLTEMAEIIQSIRLVPVQHKLKITINIT